MQELSSSPDRQQLAGEDFFAELRLSDGRIVRFRPVRPDDEPLIREAIRTSSRETLLHRFFSPIRDVSPDLLRRMLEIDRRKETCIVGVFAEGERAQILCGARYVKLSTPDRAEIALTVHDSVQRRGLGSYLLRLIATLARAESIFWFEADVLPSNQKMLDLLHKYAGHIQQEWTGDCYHLTFEVNSIPPVLPAK